MFCRRRICLLYFGHNKSMWITLLTNIIKTRLENNAKKIVSFQFSVIKNSFILIFSRLKNLKYKFFLKFKLYIAVKPL